MKKVDIGRQGLRDFLVLGELQSIVMVVYISSFALIFVDIEVNPFGLI
jgi:hypothetical protein